jgi:CRISPR-associated protein Cas2
MTTDRARAPKRRHRLAIQTGQGSAETLHDPMRQSYLVCYDISDDRRLAKVARTMRGFGDRIQLSIFECQFTPTDLAQCRHALGQIIHHTEDQVLFVNLGPAEGRGDRVIVSLGRRYSMFDAPAVIVD